MSLVLDKAARLIDLVAKGVTTLNDIAKAAQMSRSTAHRLLATLIEHRYLELNERQYSLGLRLFELGELKRRSLESLDVLRPIAQKYADLTKDRIHIAILSDRSIILLEAIGGTERQLRINSYPGMRAPAYSTAVGKALVSVRPETDWGQYVDTLPQDYPRRQIEILSDFARARRDGFATDFNEVNTGTGGIAAAFRGPNNSWMACSINGASVYFDDTRFQTLATVVRNMAAEMAQTTQPIVAADH